MAVDDEARRQIQAERDRAEIKIMVVGNGWVLKTAKNWWVHDTLDDLLAAVRSAVVDQGCPAGSRLK